PKHLRATQASWNSCPSREARTVSTSGRTRGSVFLLGLGVALGFGAALRGVAVLRLTVDFLTFAIARSVVT
ncbi:hypothetical protein RNS76_11870, partial [Staphylococcus pseudintermedius]